MNIIDILILLEVLVVICFLIYYVKYFKQRLNKIEKEDLENRKIFEKNFKNYKKYVNNKIDKTKFNKSISNITNYYDDKIKTIESDIKSIQQFIKPLPDKISINDSIGYLENAEKINKLYGTFHSNVADLLRKPVYKRNLEDGELEYVHSSTTFSKGYYITFNHLSRHDNFNTQDYFEIVVVVDNRIIKRFKVDKFCIYKNLIRSRDDDFVTALKTLVRMETYV